MMKTHTERESVDRSGDDEILPEYDFSRASRNRYVSRFPAGSTVVVLKPDVASAVRSSEEDGEA
jgi:hypothetical protein